MSNLRIFKKILFIFSLICAGIFAITGAYLLVAYISNGKTNALNKIVISNDKQSQEIVLANESMFPGDTKSYKLEIKSELVENVNYELSFANHEVSDDDKMFLVSIYTENQEVIINNTLDQIFTENYLISRSLSSFQSENLYIDFYLSDMITNQNFDFSFSIIFKANGRLIN